MRRALRLTALATMLAMGVWAMLRVQRPGHWWGDDWALYIRQAQALLNGNPSRVTAENAFTVSQSLGPPFSPPLYPWGFPMLLAPAIALFGPDIDRLAIVEMIASCVVALTWYSLARRRLGTIVALVGMMTVTMTPLLLSWTELIQSELPYVAIAFSALVAIDAANHRNVFDPDRAFWTRQSWWWLVLVGFGAAAAFTVRREGLALIPAIAAAQFVSLVTWPKNDPSAPTTRSLRATLERRLPSKRHRGEYALRLFLPHAVAAMLVFGLQVMMPSTVVPRYDGTSITNIWKYRVTIAESLGELAGFKRWWEPDPAVFSNVVAGWVAVVIYLCAGVIGLALALTVWRRRDSHLAIYTLAAFVIGGSFRSALNRYVASVGPLLLLFGLCAVAALVARWHRRWLTIAIPTAILAFIMLGNISAINFRIRNADAYRASATVEWGPTHPDAIDMFDAVKSLSQPNDVIAAPKARAMVLETGRNAVQVDDYRAVPNNASVDFVVVEQTSKLRGKLDADTAHFQRVWANKSYAIFQVL